MTQTNDTCRGGRPSGARRPGADRIAARPARVRVSSDAVISGYIHDIARPHAGGEQRNPHPLSSRPRGDGTSHGARNAALMAGGDLNAPGAAARTVRAVGVRPNGNGWALEALTHRDGSA